jgi:hypothetical protein
MANPMNATTLLPKYAISSEYCSTYRSTNAPGTYSILISTALTSDTMVLLNMYPMAAMLNILCKG